MISSTPPTRRMSVSAEMSTARDGFPRHSFLTRVGDTIAHATQPLSEARVMAKPVSRTRVFVSYSHKDGKWLERLQVHLKPLIREGAITLWEDSQIAAGEDWRAVIRAELSSARVAILLISADFLASDFIANE